MSVKDWCSVHPSWGGDQGCDIKGEVLSVNTQEGQFICPGVTVVARVAFHPGNPKESIVAAGEVEEVLEKAG